MSDAVHFEPITYVLRLYSVGNFDSGSAYDGSATVQRTGETAYISGMCGTINLAQYREVLDQIRAMGVKRLHMQRRGKVKVIDL